MIYAIIPVIFIVLSLILLAPVKVQADFNDNTFKVRVFLYGVSVYKYKPNTEKKKVKSEKAEERIQKFEKNTKTLGERIERLTDLSSTAVRLLKKYVGIEKIKVCLSVGTGDAATTAVSVGLLWAAVYSLLGIIGSVMYIDDHDVDITPDYGEEAFSLDGRCIISSRLAYIIFIAITILIKINSLKGKEE